MIRDNEEKKPSLCYIVFLTILSLALISGLVAYIVLGIIYLIQDYDLSNECKGCNLWAYVLVFLILSCMNIGIKNDSDEPLDNSLIKILIGGILNLSLSIWGGIELWNNSHSCDVFNSNLWKFGLSSFILQLFICFISLLVPIILLHYFATYENTLNSTNLRDNQDKNGIKNDLNLQINTNV